MNGLRAIVLVVAGALASLSATAWACSCIPPGSPDQERAASTHVFVGEVTSVQHVATPATVGMGWLQSLLDDIRRLLTGHTRVHPREEVRPYVRVAFDVQEQFKGPRARSLTVREAPTSAECGYAFQQGATYVVYARSQQDHLVSGLCSLTGPVTDPRTGLAQLRAGR